MFKFRKISKDQEGFPGNLMNIDWTPDYLYVLGQITKEDQKSIAVVGSRRMTKYGEDVIRSIVGDLVRAGITIVSGLALALT